MEGWRDGALLWLWCVTHSLVRPLALGHCIGPYVRRDTVVVVELQSTSTRLQLVSIQERRIVLVGASSTSRVAQC